MATIVTQYNQPYWQQAALGLATNLLGNALQRSQEADQNRKMNAVIQKSMSEANAAAGQYAGQNLLTGQPLPDGYNSDAWAKSFHEGGTPMTQFDLGTDAATGRLSTPRIPTQMEYLSSLLGNLDTQRFGGLNTKSAYEAFAPVIAAGEQAREQQLAEQQRAMQQQFANAITMANSRDEYGRALNSYLASGFAPKDAINAMQKNYEYLFPNYDKGSIDAGGAIYPYSFDPATGGYDYPTDKEGNLLGINKTMTPDEAAKIGLGYDRLNFDRSKFASEQEYNYWKANQEFGQKGQENLKARYDMLSDYRKILADKVAALQEQELSADDPQNAALVRTERDKARADLEKLDAMLDALSISAYNGGQQQGGGQGSAQVSSGVQGYSDLINKIAQEEGVDPELIMAVMQHESNGDPNAVSSAGAQGLMQLMPDTAKRFGVTNPFDPEQNIRGGAKYLKWLSDRYKGDVDKIAWGYNAGEGNADKGRMPRPKETEPYRKNVASLYNSLKSAKGQQQQPQGYQIAPLQLQETRQQTQQSQQAAPTQGAQETENSPIILMNKNDPNDVLTEAQLRDIGEGDISAGIKRAMTDPDSNYVGAARSDGFIYPSSIYADITANNEPQSPTAAVDAISGAAPDVYSPEYPGFFTGTQPSQAEEQPNEQSSQSATTSSPIDASLPADPLMGERSLYPGFYGQNSFMQKYTPEQLQSLHDRTMQSLWNELGYSPLTQYSLPLRNNPFRRNVTHDLLFGNLIY